MKCRCLNRFEKENEVSATVGAFVTMRTKDGRTKRMSLESFFCPICGKYLEGKPKEPAKKSV